MKIYLVSEITCSSYDFMTKKFEAFTTKKDAVEYKSWLVDNWLNDLMEYYKCKSINDLEVYVDIEEHDDTLWGYTCDDGAEEVEIEITELDLSSIK